MNIKLFLFFVFITNYFNLSAQNSLKKINKIEVAQIRNSLLNAGKERSFNTSKSDAISSGLVLKFPNPQGQEIEFYTIENQIVNQKLAKKFPSVKTYRLFGKNNEYGALTVGPNGLHVFFNTNTDNVVISPVSNSINEYYVFNQSDDETQEACLISEEHLSKTKKNSKPRAVNDFSTGTSLKIYKLAIITTGEFYVNNGGTAASAFAAVVSMVQSLNVVYEKEVSVSFSIMVSKLYSDPATDPFDPNSVSKALDAAIHFGSLSVSEPASFALNLYDVGHVLHHSPGGGGVAYLNGPCNNLNLTNSALSPIKGGAWSGGTTSSLTTFIHEVGHQFSAGHTFNSTSSSCNGNIMSGSAFEPGSGSTYMSYWGLCSPDNISGQVSRTYFHANSLESIYTFTQSANCNASNPYSNTAPILQTNPLSKTLIVPKGTPFKLEGSGTDAEGDTIYYNWEQYDLGLQRGGADDAQLSTTSPIFRSYAPSINGNIRFFPSIPNILIGSVPNNDEALTQVARTLNFRLTARDKKNQAGGTSSKSMILTVDNSGPFLITSQNTPVFWLTNSLKTITWSVNNTNLPPLNCTTVDILFSIDGGITFPHILASATPNDGIQEITVPNTTALGGNGRVKIMPSNTNLIFFDINNSPIEVYFANPVCESSINYLSPDTNIVSKEGTVGLNLLFFPNKPTNLVSRITSINDPTMPLIGYNSTGCTIPYSNITHFKTFTFKVSTNGAYTFTIDPAYYYGGMHLNIFSGSFGGNCTNWVAGTLNMTTGVTPSNTMTILLTAGNLYVMTMAYQWNTTATGNIPVNISGPGSVLESILNLKPYYTYNYLIVNNNTNNIMSIQDFPLLSNPAVFPVGQYKVYGFDYLTDNINFNNYLNMPISSIQTDIANGSICGKLSSNFVNVNIIPNCENILTLNGGATSGTKKAFSKIISTQTVASGQNVIYKSGGNIELNPIAGNGFLVNSGAVFKAEIGGCN